MVDFKIYTADDAPSDEARAQLQHSQDSYGFVPNLHGVFAQSAPALEGYKALFDLVGKTSLSVLERQVVFLTSNYENECRYCMAGHSGLATMEKMPADILEALRNGTTIADAKIEALRSYTAKVVRQRGQLSAEEVQAVVDAGYGPEQLLDINLIVACKVLSNYTNHLAHTPVDEGFKDFAWEKPE